MNRKSFLAFLHRRVIPTAIDRQLEKRVFHEMVNKTKMELLITNKTGKDLAFCIVHWNAPEFLYLNLRQIRAIYPESKIYVLDNGSQKQILENLKEELAKLDNVTLFSASPKDPKWATAIGSARGFYPHAVGLQLLLNESAQQQDETLVFLDQDCIIAGNIDPLIAKLNDNVELVGARDQVLVPKDYGPLKQGKMRNYPNVVHASFMIVQPQKILQTYGKYSFFSKKGVYEPYHGFSMNMLGKLFFVETKMHEQIPFLTLYQSDDVVYALHAWYSSRTTGLSAKSSLDGYPVDWLIEVNKQEFAYMEALVKETEAKNCR